MQSTKALISFGLILPLIGLYAVADQASKLDTQFLGGASMATPTPSVKTTNTPDRSKVLNKTKNIAFDEKKSDTEAVKQAIETTNSITVLLKRLAPGPNRNKLLLNHASALNMYARQKILNTKQMGTSEGIKKYLLAALKDVQEVIESPQKTAEQKWKSHDIAGTALIYLDDTPKAMEHFHEVLKLNPPDDKAGRIGLMIAEDLFDQSKYKEASEYYLQYFSKMTPQWQELAYYKLGWCMINLGQPDDAEKYLVKVAKSTSVSGVGKDAIRDLAYVVTHRTDPAPSIQNAESHLETAQDRLAFLKEVRANFEFQGANEFHAKMVVRLMEMEKEPEKRLELAFANLRVERKLYASKSHLDAFVKMATSLRAFSEKALPNILAKYDTVLENETQALMKSFIDTYAGRVKTSEPLSKTDLGEAMKLQFKFYYQYLNRKPNFPSIVSIWSDICLDMKDWVCVDYVSQIILTKPDRLGTFKERAYLDQITALDQFLLNPKKTTADQKQWSERRSTRIKEFIDQFPSSPQWIQVAKLYSQNEMDQGHEKSALPILNQIMTKDPSEDAFYRLQYARFKIGVHESLLTDLRGKPYMDAGSKVIELYRESSLILAERARESHNVDQYRMYVNSFISYSKDPAKIKIARSDYFNFLIKGDLLDTASAEFYALPAEEIARPEYKTLQIDLWKKAIVEGKFELALKVAKNSDLNEKSDEWLQRRILARLFLGMAPTTAELNSLPTRERDYFLGLMSLVKPQAIIDYYKARHQSLNEADRAFLLLSYKLKLEQWFLIRSPELENFFGRNYPFVDQPSNTPLLIESNIAGIRFPELKKFSAKKQSTLVQANLENVRYVRSILPKVIKGKPQDDQVRVLTEARDLEAKMANYLLTSPLPKGLTSEQNAQYQEGIKSAADEFVQQSKQLDALITKIGDETIKNQRWLIARTLPAPDMAKWSWPKAVTAQPELKWVLSFIQSGNLIGALTLLDYHRPTLVKLDEEFFTIRSGILLAGNPNSVLRLYVLEELEKNKQDTVIKNWAALVRRPVPEVK